MQLTAIHDKTQALKDGEDPDNTPSRSALVSLHNNTRQNSKRVKRDLTHQDDAQRALKFISMPASGNNDLNKDGVKYNYDDSAGRGIRLYVIDSGANPDSSVSIWSSKIEPAIADTRTGMGSERRWCPFLHLRRTLHESSAG